MEVVYISLGSNIGNRLSYINSAIDKIMNSEIDITAVSPFYLTEPWGKTDQNEFINCVIEIKTEKSPWDLLGIFQSIEKELGKSIKVRWGERTIDIDIVLYGRKVIFEKKITIPHPRYRKRNFVLIPLCDISENIFDPIAKKYSGEMLKQIKDNNKVKRFNEN